MCIFSCIDKREFERNHLMEVLCYTSIRWLCLLDDQTIVEGNVAILRERAIIQYTIGECSEKPLKFAIREDITIEIVQ